MKPVSLILFLILCCATSLCAQTRDRKRELDRVNNTTIKEVRQTFERNEADGLKVTIYKATTRGMVPVSPQEIFRSGDRFKLRFQSNFDGYIYVINVTSGDENRLLFPRGVSRHNNVRGGQSYNIPAANEFQFNDDPGLEILQILMSRTPIPFLEEVVDAAPLKANYIVLDGATKKALRQLAGKPIPLKTGGISANSKPTLKREWQSRMLSLDRQKETTFLVLSNVKGSPTRFQPREISVVEIALNHR